MPNANVMMPILSNELVVSGVCSNNSVSAPVITGIASKKENRDASLREKPSNLPAAMVMPDRDTPGRSANICNKPTPKPLRNSGMSVRTHFLCML